MRDQRLAIVVTPAAREDVRGRQGTLDGDVMRERLAQADTRFDVVVLDADRDLAEQIDALFDARPEGEWSVLFYASTRASVADDELFLCLDPAEPETGDALRDVVEVLKDRGGGPLVVILELCHEPSDDPLVSAEMVDHARRAIRAVSDDVELLAACSPVISSEASSPSAFTRAVLETLDEIDPGAGLNAFEVYDIVNDGRLLGIVRAMAHVAAEDSFMVLPASEVTVDVAETPDPPTPVDDAPTEPPSPVDDAPTEPPPAVARAREPDEADEEHAPLSTDEVTSPDHGVPFPEPSKRSLELDPPPPPHDLPPVSERAPQSLPPRSFPPTAQPDVDVVLDEARAQVRDGDHEGALASYRKALGLGSLEKEARGHVYRKMGTLKALQGKNPEAIANLEKALTLASDDETMTVLEQLLTLYTADHDHRAASTTQERILKALPEQHRLEALLRFGHAWLAMPGEQLRARQMLERAERVAPEHLEILGLLKDLGEAEGRTEEVLGLRRRIADATRNPRDRAAKLASLGVDLAKRGREDEALELLETSLDEDPTRLEPLAKIAEILSERQEWSELESSYRRMLARLPRLEPASVRAEVSWELNRRLGLVLRDHLDDPTLALAAFDRASDAKPSDAGVRKMAIDLARGVDDVDAAQRHLVALATLEPREPRIYRLLFDAFMKDNDVERASEAAAALVVLGAAADKERIVFEANRPEGAPKIAAPLSDEAWDRVVHREPELSAVSAIFDAVGAAAAAALAEVIKKTQAERLPSEKLRIDPDETTVSAARSLAWASRALGINAPTMYLDDKSPASYSAVLCDPPATRIGSGALRGRSVLELAFLAGRHITYQAPRHRLLALCPSIEDLSACFLAAVALATGEANGPPSMKRVVADLVPRIEAWLGGEELEQLKEAVEQFTEQGGRADLFRYVGSIERTSLRLGMLLCGDLGVAAALAGTGLFEGGYRDALSESDRVNELLGFVVSDAYTDVRSVLIAVD